MQMRRCRAARSRSPWFVGTSRVYVILREYCAPSEIYYRTIGETIVRQHAIASGKAAAIHNIKRIHCYFSSAGVIGIPVHVDSRLHCTDVAIHSS